MYDSNFTWSNLYWSFLIRQALFQTFYWLFSANVNDLSVVFENNNQLWFLHLISCTIIHLLKCNALLTLKSWRELCWCLRNERKTRQKLWSWRVEKYWWDIQITIYFALFTCTKKHSLCLEHNSYNNTDFNMWILNSKCQSCNL